MLIASVTFVDQAAIAIESWAGNVVGAGTKPSSLMTATAPQGRLYPLSSEWLSCGTWTIPLWPTPAVFAISTKPEDQLKPGLPPTDRRQLMEYTFADAVTKNGLPFTITLTGVGYNISSVDQVYLPVAMEP